MKILLKWLKLGSSVIFLVVVIRWAKPDRLLALAREADLFYLITSLFLSFGMVAASTWKWWLLLRLQSHPLAFAQLYRIYFIGYFYSNFLPSNIGGDVARVMLAGKACRSNRAATVSVFVERLTGALFLLFMAAVSPLIFPAGLLHPEVRVAMAFGITGLLGLLAIGLTVGKAAWLREDASADGQADEKVQGAIKRKLRSFAAGLRELAALGKENPSALAGVAGLTALFYILMIANVAVGYRVFGVWPELVALVAVLPGALIMAMLPVTMGNLGIAEFAYVYFFGLAGMPGDLTGAMGLLLRGKILVLGAIGLLVNMTLKKDMMPGKT